MLFVLFSLFLFFSCSENSFEKTIDFRRSPSFFQIQLSEITFHNNDLLFARWKVPSNTEQLLGHYFILDTNNWNDSKIQYNRLDENFIFDRPVIFIPWNGQSSDSLLFLLDSLDKPVKKDTLDNNIFFFKIDSNKHLNSNKIDFTFALVAVYSSGLPGKNRFSKIIIGDLFPPQVILSDLQVSENSVILFWQRPRDPFNFFNDNINADTGIIQKYYLTIEDIDNGNLISFFPLNLTSILFITHKDTLSFTNSNLISILTIKENENDRGRSIAFSIKDSSTYQSTLELNNISLELKGLSSEQTYRYFIYAQDSKGNFNQRDSEKIFFTTTDDSKPTSAIITQTEQTEQNQVTVRWLSSKDTRFQDTTTHSHILQYLVEIIETSENNVSFPRVKLIIPQEHHQDSIFIDQNIIYYPNTNRAYFELQRNFTLPNTQITFKIVSQDSSFYLSDTSTSSIKLLSLLDTLATSFRCPFGYSIIITSDTFCIQNYEYQEIDSQFNTQITQQDAIKTCLDRGTPQDSFFLCSEEQWERACQGSGIPLSFGIQSIDSNKPLLSLTISSLQNICNIETGNEAIAKNKDNRNSKCVTNEGIYDLPGNYSEWVQTTKDSLIFKGSNYLPTSTIFANNPRYQCLFDGIPQQTRPAYLSSCISEQENISFHLKNDSIFCPKFNKKIVMFKWISKLIDQINTPRAGAHLFFEDDTQDSLFFLDSNGANITAITGNINPPNLLIVKFQSKDNPALFVFDTLDFTPFQFFNTPLNLGEPSNHILLSQITSSAWQAIPTKIIHATFIKNKSTNNNLIDKPAKIYYNHQSLGFRCCSKAR